jgi:hypothetical protein
MVLNYYTGKLPIKISINESRFANLIDRLGILNFFYLKPTDIEFLRSIYLPEKYGISELIGNDLSSWDYGYNLLNKLNGDPQ